ncbi:unnamed protein product [Knipowitschia caucasica]
MYFFFPEQDTDVEEPGPVEASQDLKILVLSTEHLSAFPPEPAPVCSIHERLAGNILCPGEVVFVNLTPLWTIFGPRVVRAADVAVTGTEHMELRPWGHLHQRGPQTHRVEK